MDRNHIKFGSIFCYFHWLPPVWISPLYQGMHCIGAKANSISHSWYRHTDCDCFAPQPPFLCSAPSSALRLCSKFVPKIFLNQTRLQTETWHMNCEIVDGRNYWGTKIDGRNYWRTKILLLLTVYQTGFFSLKCWRGGIRRKDFILDCVQKFIHLT